MTTTMVDAQSAIAVVLKPPTGFEALYEGQPGTIPIPFVSKSGPDNAFTVLDELAGEDGVAADLVKFVPVPIGGTALIVIPRALYNNSGTLRAPSYVYDFRWRLRTVTDNTRSTTATHPYSMLEEHGAPSDPAPTAREILPAFTSEQVTPAVVGSTARPLVATNSFGAVSQGIYALADFASLAVPGGDAALGPNFFPPYLRALLGNELGIVATKPSGNWSFTDTGASGDAAFSNVYGRNVAGPVHRPYDGVGILLIMLARAVGG